MARAGRFGTKGLAITFLSSEEDSATLNEESSNEEVDGDEDGEDAGKDEEEEEDEDEDEDVAAAEGAEAAAAPFLAAPANRFCTAAAASS